MNRFYRALLRLYPVSFRQEYGDELLETFNARTAGQSSVARLFAAVADVVPNALATHREILSADLRQAGRTMRRSPGFAITAVLVVALGVGANTAAFSIADFVLIRPLPFVEPERLVKVWETTPGYGALELSPGNFADWKATARSFESMGAFNLTAVNLTGAGEPQRLQALDATPEVLTTLGVQPEVGRLFTVADTAGGRIVLLSHALWQTQFGGDRSIIGKQIELDGVPVTIVGVMPPSFHFPRAEVALWKPLILSVPQNELENRTNSYLQVIARLKPGVTLEQARSELSMIAKRLEQQYPEGNEKTGAAVFRLDKEVSERSRMLIIALCGAALCVLLLACANLANLLLARAASRERELAVRTALGAGRERIIRQILTESLTLAVLGGLAGVLVAVIAVPTLARLVPSNLPIAQQPSVDLRVLIFAALLVLVTTLAFGILPAMRASSVGSLRTLREDNRGGARQRTRSALVVIEVMASVVLLISSGLLVRAIWRLHDVDPGFRAENVLTLRTALPWTRYSDTRVRTPFYDRVLAGIRALPEVQSAAYISFLPMAMRGGVWAVSVDGRTEEVRGAGNTASLRFATPQIFDALGVRLQAGRSIDDTDGRDRPPTAVVSESFARRYWPGQSPLGKRFKVAFKERTIVGVVADVRVRGLEQQSEPQFYLPYQQQDSGSLISYVPKDLVIRSTAKPGTLLPAIRRIIHDADPLQPISDVRTMEEIVANETAGRLAQLRVLAIFAAVALLLSAVGIHGLLSFTVSRRSREIGVRMALGAQSAQVRRMVLREGVLLALGGVIPGAAIAYAAGRAMQSLLAGVAPGDGLTFTLATLLCVVATFTGCLAPAFRASRVDPMMAMRAEG